MEFSITNPGIDAPEALGVLKEDGASIPNSHIGLVGMVSLVPIHIDHFLDLLFKILSIGILFQGGFG
jgi:hypothetical protein